MKASRFIFILTFILVAGMSCQSEDDAPPSIMDLFVYVFDSESGDPIRGVSLSLKAKSNPGRTINPNSSDDSGKYVFRSLEVGDYNLYAEKTGYIQNSMPVEILPNKTNEVSISITKISD
jgi:uncharacterized surface anchored protein